MPQTHPTDAETFDVQIPVPLSRDPRDYEPTTHYIQQYRTRVPEPLQSYLTGDVIERGRITATAAPALPDDVTAEDDGRPVALTATVDARPWTVVVALRPATVFDPDRNHTAVTVYQGTPTGAGE